MDNVKYPSDAPAWLRDVVEQLDEASDRSMKADEPARAVGFFCAVKTLKDAIHDAAATEADRRQKEIRELTYPKTN